MGRGTALRSSVVEGRRHQRNSFDESKALSPRAPPPSRSARWSPSSAIAGTERNRQAPSFSRCDASEVLGTARGKTPGVFDRVTPKFLGPGGRTGFGSIKLDARPGLRKRNPGSEWRIANSEWKFLVSYSLLLFATRHSPFAKKTRQAERRQTPPHQSAPSGAARALRGALRLPAFHRGSHGSEPTPPLSSSPRFLGRGFGGRYSASACPSPAIQSQAGHNAGRAFSRSRPGAEVTSPCPQAPLSLHQPE